MKFLIARSIDFYVQLIDHSEFSKREFGRMKDRAATSSASNSLELLAPPFLSREKVEKELSKEKK
jgi:hypothetical protein